MTTNYTEIVEGIPNIEYGLTPITDEMFIRQGWERKTIGSDDDPFHTFEDIEDSDIFPENVDDFDDELQFGSEDDADDAPDSYYWILKLPRNNPIEDVEMCPVLISSLSDEILTTATGQRMLEDGQYIVQIFDFFDLGTCFSEEEVEILYRSLTGSDIYDF